jgi:hypothetical protein
MRLVSCAHVGLPRCPQAVLRGRRWTTRAGWLAAVGLGISSLLSLTPPHAFSHLPPQFSDQNAHQKGQWTCIHNTPETIGTNANQDGYLLYPVEGGFLPGYGQGDEVGCAVCGTSGAAASNSVYTRWGRNDCPAGHTMLYAGQVAGSWYAHRGGGNVSFDFECECAFCRLSPDPAAFVCSQGPLCAAMTPELQPLNAGASLAGWSYLYRTEYETGE